ncbi:hypothetical protein JXA32_09355 [Candidatus Sumerlaeota bacterium]|nr:hypothetical protein [Candidatus Sumerlaeota bacterium]
MESSDVSSQEKLDRLFAEKKITQAEYERLQRSLAGGASNVEDEKSIEDQRPVERSKQLPWQVWLSIGILTVAGFMQFALLIGKQPLAAIIIVAISIPMIYGLYHKHRWAFIVFIVFCLISIIGVFKNPIAVLLNLIFGFILFTAHPYFFSKRDISIP